MSETSENYLKAAGVDYAIHIVDGPTVNAKDAADQLRVPLQMIIKSILFTDEKSSPFLAIITGDKRVDKKKLSGVVGVSKLRIASPEAAKTMTGFEVGTMPPVGHKNRITTVIDKKVMNLNKVYGGTGKPEALIEINPQDIARLAEAKVADICE